MTTITNKIVTSGFGPSRGVPGRAGPVTQGYGSESFFVDVAQAEAQRIMVRGGSKGRPRYDELLPIVVWARLVEVNGREPLQKIEGSTSISSKESRVVVAAELRVSRNKKAWERIKVAARRLVRR